MIETVRKPILTIPCETETFDAFRSRLSLLIRDDKTHIYIDTSFLMWMTKIGSQSRQELFAWLNTNCNGRVHVPIWTAHEYLKHHVARTLVTELGEKAEEVAALAGQTYSYFRPFFDEIPDSSSGGPSAVRASTRSALNTLGRLAIVTRQWQKSYQKHSSEVIAFINANTPEKTPVHDYFLDLPDLGAGRFVGSIPPGFQDRRKRGSGGSAKRENREAPADSNRFGDLVFWKELLDHAKDIGARAIIVLTNDRKNDWYLGGTEPAQLDPSLLALRKSWKPVPRPHPMLAMEARLVAKSEELELLDAPYLAALLREIAEEEVRSFVDVAIIPDGEEPENEGERRARLIKERRESETAKTNAVVSEKRYLFADAPEVVTKVVALQRALLESRKPVTERIELMLREWRATVEARIPIRESLTPAKMDGLDHKALVHLARELHDRVLREESGYLETLVDLVSLLDELPPNTATCLYLGFLSSMYLERDGNTSRLPPKSPVAPQLFERQSAAIAASAIDVVARRLNDNEFRPLYIPTVDIVPISIALETEANAPNIDELRSLLVGRVELLTAAQSDEKLRLSAIFGSRALVGGDAIVQKACELFAIPIGQVEHAEAFPLRYSLTDTIGFKRPVDVSIPKELDRGN